jgi:hypothetical protein
MQGRVAHSNRFVNITLEERPNRELTGVCVATEECGFSCAMLTFPLFSVPLCF